MASYDELYMMVTEASAKEAANKIKKGIGKAAGVANDYIKTKTGEADALADAAKIDGATNAQHKAAKMPIVNKKGVELMGKRKEFMDKGSAASKVVKGTENAVKAVTKIPGKTIGTVSKVATEVPARALSTPFKMKLDSDTKKKYGDDPEKLEQALRTNVKKVAAIKKEFVAMTIITYGYPIALKSLGTLDNVFKILIAAGASQNKDKELTSSALAAYTGVAYYAVALNKIRKIMSDMDGNVEEHEEEFKGVKRELLQIITDVLDKLEDWAKSDEPLYKKIKDKVIETKDKLEDNVAKNIGTVKENAGLAFLMLYDSYMENTISEEEFLYLSESVIPIFE